MYINRNNNLSKEAKCTYKHCFKCLNCFQNFMSRLIFYVITKILPNRGLIFVRVFLNVFIWKQFLDDKFCEFSCGRFQQKGFSEAKKLEL